MNPNNEKLNELALFAGAGGGILGGHLLGWNCVCAVEWEPYPAGVLIARQNEGFLPPFPIWDDVQTFDGRPWRGIVDVVSGGFPCQDISSAKGPGAKGIKGERSGMWVHMARILGEVRPRYALVENSPNLTFRGLDVVLADLAALGYDAAWGVYSAADVGARHIRERIWIVAADRDTHQIAKEQIGGIHGYCKEPLRAMSEGLSASPKWVDVLMGFPAGWTHLEPLETPKYRQWSDLHGIPSTNASKAA
jgi:DNA (cytosine-5)-methyltransferase 1